MYISADVKREEKGKKIANKKDAVKRLNETRYRVRSQSGNGMYYVEKTAKGWKCDCPDHKFRGMICKHIWAVKISIGMREQAKPMKILEPITITGCPECGSSHIRRDGVRHNKSGDLQKYKCLDCGKFFSVNVGFEKIKNSPQAITTAMQLYFSGESLRNTMKSFMVLLFLTLSQALQSLLIANKESCNCPCQKYSQRAVLFYRTHRISV